MSDLSKVLAEAWVMATSGDPCRDHWSWFGSSPRDCELPFGHTGCHESGGIRWNR